jgi:hypothetical protein
LVKSVGRSEPAIVCCASTASGLNQWINPVAVSQTGDQFSDLAEIAVGHWRRPGRARFRTGTRGLQVGGNSFHFVHFWPGITARNS